MRCVSWSKRIGVGDASYNGALAFNRRRVLWTRCCVSWSNRIGVGDASYNSALAFNRRRVLWTRCAVPLGRSVSASETPPTTARSPSTVGGFSEPDAPHLLVEAYRRRRRLLQQRARLQP